MQGGMGRTLPEAWKYIQENGIKKVQAEPPSVVIQNAFNQAIKSGKDILGDTEQLEHLAKKTNLTVKETAMWLKHLDGFRKRRVQGARKAAVTREANKGKYPIKHPNIVVTPLYGSV